MISPSSFLLFLSLCSLLYSTSAQAPPGLRASAYASDGKTLYIQGGRVNSLPFVNSLYTLDLTQSWTSASVSFTTLSSLGAPAEYAHAAALTRDGTELIVWPSNRFTSFYRYNIAGRTWTSGLMPAGWDGNRTVGIATDPGSGLMYIPAGATENRMLVFDPVRGVASAFVNMPTGMLPNIMRYGWQWNAVRGAFLLYGGAGGEVGNTILWEYKPSTGQWTPLTTSGQPPADIVFTCFQPAYGGAHMILFGGAPVKGDSSGILYVLDVIKLVWTPGPMPDPSNNRSAMTCATAGDDLVIWGGDYRKDTTAFSQPLIYNMRTRQWGNQFSPTPSGTDTSVPVQPTNNPNNGGSDPVKPIIPDDDKLPIAAIIGGSVGGVVVVFFFALWFGRRRGRAYEKRQQEINNAMAASNGNSEREHFLNNGDNGNLPPPPPLGSGANTTNRLSDSGAAAFAALPPSRTSGSTRPLHSDHGLNEWNPNRNSYSQSNGTGGFYDQASSTYYESGSRPVSSLPSPASHPASSPSTNYVHSPPIPARPVRAPSALLVDENGYALTPLMKGLATAGKQHLPMNPEYHPVIANPQGLEQERAALGYYPQQQNYQQGAYPPGRNPQDYGGAEVEQEMTLNPARAPEYRPPPHFYPA